MSLRTATLLAGLTTEIVETSRTPVRVDVMSGGALVVLLVLLLLL